MGTRGVALGEGRGVRGGGDLDRCPYVMSIRNVTIIWCMTLIIQHYMNLPGPAGSPGPAAARPPPQAPPCCRTMLDQQAQQQQQQRRQGASPPHWPSRAALGRQGSGPGSTYPESNNNNNKKMASLCTAVSNTKKKGRG